MTCFPPDAWSYAATYELDSKEDAQLLETAVLHACRNHRLGDRELVALPLETIVGTAAAAAAELGLAPRARRRPVYPPPPPRAPPAAELGPGARPDARWETARARIDRLTVAPDAGAGAPPPPPLVLPSDEDLSALLEQMQLDAPVAAPQPPPPPPLSPPPQVIIGGGGGGGGGPSADNDDEMDVESWIEIRVDEPEAPPAPQPLALREYQAEAVERCSAELRASGRAVLMMACRCGKTAVGYQIIERYAERNPVLLLVPGLSLLRQTAQKLLGYAAADPASVLGRARTLLVGSDPVAVPLPGRPPQAMTTDPEAIRAFLAEGGAALVISTYQSSPLVPTDAFALTVFDEAHRTCGGDAPRPFNHQLLAPRVGCRLFMTATPYVEPAPLTMRDRDRFGGVAHRYHLRQGIDAGYVNPFRLELVAAPVSGGGPAAASAPPPLLPAQVRLAMSRVDKLLVYCRNIKHATELAALTASGWTAGEGAPFEVLVAHSRMGPGQAADVLRRFARPGARAALFNVRLFQEGVEVPDLNGIFFAAPRHAARDIIQSICRPLNAMPGKPESVVFLPVSYDPARAPDDAANLERLADIVPFVDALLSEDPRLFEHLLDPAATPYPIEVLGTRSMALTTPAAKQRLLTAVRRAVRYGKSTAARPAERLLRVENLPWDRAFGEMKRIVTDCWRYPKTTDGWRVGEASVNLHNFYGWCQREYKLAAEGKASALEPHQILDLESLPSWKTYGVSGPYPWKECLESLEQWLAEHDGVPPMLEVHTGGFVGLSASPMERLSGAMTVINQSDGKDRANSKKVGSGFTVSADKARDLDELCARWGLRWRKQRDAEGRLVEGGPPTFIQESYTRFKAYWAEVKAGQADREYIDSMFPDYPMKHRRQEYLDVQKAKSAPPRWSTLRRQDAKAAASSGGAAAAGGGDGGGAAKAPRGARRQPAGRGKEQGGFIQAAQRLAWFGKMVVGAAANSQ